MWKITLALAVLNCWAQTNQTSNTTATTPAAPANITANARANFDCLNKQVGSNCTGAIQNFSGGSSTAKNNQTSTAPAMRVSPTGTLVNKADAETALATKTAAKTANKSAASTASSGTAKALSD
jgi:hypothetical protein